MFGVDVGDLFLRAVAGRLTGAVRADDFLARSAGDEFVLLLTVASHIRIRDLSQRAAARIQDTMRTPFELNGPTRGLVGPGVFMPLVERTSLMRELTARMLADALHACAAWQRDGLALSVAVNVSGRDLANPDLVPTVASALERVGVAATALTIEITETALMNDLARASDAIHQLRSLGIGVSVDDSGTGWSSLAHLLRLPVTELKIDGSFVADTRTDAGAAKTVSAMISLGQSLGLRVVAEGVEDAETLEWLAGLRCDQAQGWHVGRPMPPADLAAFARAHVPRPASSLPAVAEVAE